jgi:hypothetical protein
MRSNVDVRFEPTDFTAGNDHDRNASGNQVVLDRGGAGLVFQKANTLDICILRVWLDTQPN